MSELAQPPALLAGLLDAAARLDDLTVLDPAFLAVEAKQRAFEALAHIEAVTAALRLRVVAAADESGDVAKQSGARSVADWQRARLRLHPAKARSELKLARALSGRWVNTLAALADGRINQEHARVISESLDRLPDDVPTAVVAKAENVLLDEATRFDPSDLRRIGAKIWETVDPETFEHAEAKRLAAQEAAAWVRTEARLRDNHDGTYELLARLPKSSGIKLKTYLESFAQPRKQQRDHDCSRVPYERLLGQALCHLIDRMDPAGLPHHGGDATTVFVTMTLDQLRSELGTAGIGFDGDTITAGEARRLACQAHLIPVVLGGDSEILDVGRSQRLHPPVHRKVIRLRDQHCRAEGCTIPAAWCDVHHLHPWSLGGRTSVRDGALLCSQHHHLVHSHAYTVERLPNGDIRFHRRS